jgi:hypothetical protein
VYIRKFGKYAANLLKASTWRHLINFVPIA